MLLQILASVIAIVAWLALFAMTYIAGAFAIPGSGRGSFGLRVIRWVCIVIRVVSTALLIYLLTVIW